MKKFLLLSMFISLTFAGISQNQAPVAVDDTIPGYVKLGIRSTITF